MKQKQKKITRKYNAIVLYEKLVFVNVHTIIKERKRSKILHIESNSQVKIHNVNCVEANKQKGTAISIKEKIH